MDGPSRGQAERFLRALGLVALAISILGGLLVLAFALSFGAADHAQVSIQAQPLSPDGVVDDGTVELDPAGQAVLAEAVANGTARSTAASFDPVFAGAHWYQVHGQGLGASVFVEHEGRFYRLAVTNASAVELQRPTVGLQPVDRADGHVTDYDALPFVDQSRIREALRYNAITDCDPADESAEATRCWAIYEPGDVNASALVPSTTTDYVRYDNRTFRVVVRERSVDALALTYAAERVASDQEAFRAHLATDVDPGVLTDRERAMFDEAVEGEFRVRRSRRDPRSLPVAEIDGLLAALDLPPVAELRPGHHGRAVSYVRLGETYYRVIVVYRDTYA